MTNHADIARAIDDRSRDLIVSTAAIITRQLTATTAALTAEEGAHRATLDLLRDALRERDEARTTRDAYESEVIAIAALVSPSADQPVQDRVKELCEELTERDATIARLTKERDAIAADRVAAQQWRIALTGENDRLLARVRELEARPAATGLVTDEEIYDTYQAAPGSHVDSLRAVATLASQRRDAAWQAATCSADSEGATVMLRNLAAERDNARAKLAVAESAHAAFKDEVTKGIDGLRADLANAEAKLREAEGRGAVERGINDSTRIRLGREGESRGFDAGWMARAKAGGVDLGHAMAAAKAAYFGEASLSAPIAPPEAKPDAPWRWICTDEHGDPVSLSTSRMEPPPSGESFPVYRRPAPVAPPSEERAKATMPRPSTSPVRALADAIEAYHDDGSPDRDSWDNQASVILAELNRRGFAVTRMRPADEQPAPPAVP